MTIPDPQFDAVEILQRVSDQPGGAQILNAVVLEMQVEYWKSKALELAPDEDPVES